MKISTIAILTIFGALSLGTMTACKPFSSTATPANASPKVAATTPPSANTAVSTNAATPTKADSATTAMPNDIDDKSAASSDQAQGKEYNTAERSRRREALRKQILAVLTPDQAKQLNSKLHAGEKTSQALSELNLTKEQKTQLHAIAKAAHPQSAAAPHPQGAAAPQKVSQ
jgi:hypothetical protein